MQLTEMEICSPEKFRGLLTFVTAWPWRRRNQRWAVSGCCMQGLWGPGQLIGGQGDANGLQHFLLETGTHLPSSHMLWGTERQSELLGLTLQ